MEWFDLYDKNRRPLGTTHQRGIPLPKGTYHIVAHVWIIDSRGRLLLTLRSPEKPNYPNTWAITGGAVVAGETSLEGIAREVFEETGIRAGTEEFRLLGSTRRKDSFSDTYLLKKDVPLEELVMQEGETCDARWVTRREFEALIARGVVAPPDVRRYHQLADILGNSLR